MRQLLSKLVLLPLASAACASRSQFAVLAACQMPLKFGRALRAVDCANAVVVVRASSAVIAYGQRKCFGIMRAAYCGGAEPPRNSFLPSGSVMSRPLARLAPSRDR